SFVHGGRARHHDPRTHADSPRVSDDRFPLRSRRDVLTRHAPMPRTRIVTRPKKPRAARAVETSFDPKAERVLRAVRRAEQFAEEGEMPLKRFCVDRQVAPCGEGDEGLAGSVKKVDCGRPRALLRALASSHGSFLRSPSDPPGRAVSWSSEALPAVAARREN